MGGNLLKAVKSFYGDHRASVQGMNEVDTVYGVLKSVLRNRGLGINRM